MHSLLDIIPVVYARRLAHWLRKNSRQYCKECCVGCTKSVTLSTDDAQDTQILSGCLMLQSTFIQDLHVCVSSTTTKHTSHFGACKMKESADSGPHAVGSGPKHCPTFGCKEDADADAAIDCSSPEVYNKDDDDLMHDPGPHTPWNYYDLGEGSVCSNPQTARPSNATASMPPRGRHMRLPTRSTRSQVLCMKEHASRWKSDTR